jgi:hypothetical protein
MIKGIEGIEGRMAQMPAEKHKYEEILQLLQKQEFNEWENYVRPSMVAEWKKSHGEAATYRLREEKEEITKWESELRHDQEAVRHEFDEQKAKKRQATAEVEESWRKAREEAILQQAEEEAIRCQQGNSG